MHLSENLDYGQGRAIANRKPGGTQPEGRKSACNLCGKPSASMICAACADKVRAEALARKKREDKGEE